MQVKILTLDGSIPVIRSRHEDGQVARWKPDTWPFRLRGVRDGRPGDRKGLQPTLVLHDLAPGATVGR